MPSFLFLLWTIACVEILVFSWWLLQYDCVCVFVCVYMCMCKEYMHSDYKPETQFNGFWPKCLKFFTVYSNNTGDKVLGNCVNCPLDTLYCHFSCWYLFQSICVKIKTLFGQSFYLVLSRKQHSYRGPHPHVHKDTFEILSGTQQNICNCLLPQSDFTLSYAMWYFLES